MKQKILESLKKTNNELHKRIELLNEVPNLNSINNAFRYLETHRKEMIESQMLFNQNKEFKSLQNDLLIFEKQLKDLKEVATKPVEVDYSNSKMQSKTIARNLDDLLSAASDNFDNLKQQGKSLKLQNESHFSMDSALEISKKKLNLITNRLKHDKKLLFLVIFLIFLLIGVFKFL